MLTHPTFDQLRALKLTGMLKALQEQEQMPDIGCLGFMERLGLLVDREITERENRRPARRLLSCPADRTTSCRERVSSPV